MCVHSVCAKKERKRTSRVRLCVAAIDGIAARGLTGRRLSTIEPVIVCSPSFALSLSLFWLSECSHSLWSLFYSLSQSFLLFTTLFNAGRGNSKLNIFQSSGRNKRIKSRSRSRRSRVTQLLTRLRSHSHRQQRHHPATMAQASESLIIYFSLCFSLLTSPSHVASPIVRVI